MTDTYPLHPIGYIRSDLRVLEQAPRQGREGAPDAWLEIEARFADALLGLEIGDEIIVITWLHRGDRSVLQVHPRNDPHNPLAGVFNTRSPDRPNPLGLHPVIVREMRRSPSPDGRGGQGVRIGPIEAIDGTPVVDIKSGGS